MVLQFPVNLCSFETTWAYYLKHAFTSRLIEKATILSNDYINRQQYLKFITFITVARVYLSDDFGASPVIILAEEIPVSIPV